MVLSGTVGTYAASVRNATFMKVNSPCRSEKWSSKAEVVLGKNFWFPIPKHKYLVVFAQSRLLCWPWTHSAPAPNGGDWWPGFCPCHVLPDSIRFVFSLLWTWHVSWFTVCQTLSLGGILEVVLGADSRVRNTSFCWIIALELSTHTTQVFYVQT